MSSLAFLRARHDGRHIDALNIARQEHWRDDADPTRVGDWYNAELPEAVRRAQAEEVRRAQAERMLIRYLDEARRAGLVRHWRSSVEDSTPERHGQTKIWARFAPGAVVADLDRMVQAAGFEARPAPDDEMLLLRSH